MNTLGSVTKSTFLKEVEAHKLHQEFEVQQTSATITFDADLITANVINGKIDGVSIAQVTFATSHTNTMNLLKAELEAHPSVASVTLTDTVNNRQLTIVPVDQTEAPVLSNWAVTAGASQAATATATDFNKVYPGVPVELTADGKVQPLTVATASTTKIGTALHLAGAGEMVTVAMDGAAIIFAEADAALNAGPVKWESFNTETERNRYNDTSITATNQTGWSIDVAEAEGDEIRVVLKF